MSQVTGRVLAKQKVGNNKNRLFLATDQYGRIIVKAVVSDEDAKDITWNDYVQLSGKTRKRTKILDDGTSVKDVLLMKPVLERRIHGKRITFVPYR